MGDGGGVYAISDGSKCVLEAVREKTGNMEVLAAVGPNADAFAPPAATEFVLVKQILPSMFPVFSLTASSQTAAN